MFIMQCVEFDEKKIKRAFEKYNCTFKEMYENIMKLLSNKQGRTIEEQFFIDRPLNEEFYPRDYHIVDPGFFTIFTRMYPEISFRLFEITNDMCSCSTYIFRGEQYAFEKELKNFECDTITEIEGIKFRNENSFRAYKPENLDVILDIMNIEIYDGDNEIYGVVNETMSEYGYCLQFVSPSMKNLDFTSFEGFSEKFTKLAESWYHPKPATEMIKQPRSQSPS